MTPRDGCVRRIWQHAVPMSVRRSLYGVRREAARAGKGALARLYDGRPVPFWAVAALRVALPDKDALLPPDGALVSDSSGLANAYLRGR
jgi:hypothetical protein